MDFQQIITIITLAGGAAGAVWAVVAKVVIPSFVESRQRKQAAEIADRADQREYFQKIDSERLRYQQLQDSWQNDRLSALLEENESFIRDVVYKKLETIEGATARTATAEQLERIARQLQDLDSKFRIMVGTFAEFYDSHRAQNRRIDADGGGGSVADE